MKLCRTCAAAVAALALCCVAFPALANTPPTEDPNEAFRGELATYFTNLAENSPTLLGKLADDPQTMADIAATIDGLSAEQLQEMREEFAAVPNWQVVPEALYSSLPPDARQQITEEGQAAGAKAAEADAFRSDLARLATLARMLPSDGEDGGGIDPASLDALQQNLGQMHPLQVAQLKDQVTAQTDFQAVSTQAMGALPASTRAGLDALAAHGPLSVEDIDELEAFRVATVELLVAADALPEEVRSRLELGELEEVVARLEDSNPEMLYLLRQEIDLRAIEEAARAVDVLVRAASLTAADIEHLEVFRSEVAETFWQGGEYFDPVQEQISGLEPEQLFVLQDRLAGHPGWQQNLPAILMATSGDQVAHQLAQLQDPGADKALVRELEQYRTEMVDRLAMVGAAPGTNPSRADAALRVMREATPQNLVLMRAVGAALPEGAPAEVVVDSLLLTKEFEKGCGINVVCWVTDIFDAVTKAVPNAINSVKGLVENIWNGIKDIGVAIKDLFMEVINLEFIDIDGTKYSLKDLIDDPTLLGPALVGGWEFLQDIDPNLVPDLPCPPDGTIIPFIGEVGEGNASDKYNNYKWLFDKLLGLIPDTEISLVVKIPAQIAYAGLEYFGMCLENAAEARDGQATEGYRASVGQGFATSQSYQTSILNNQVGLFASISALSGQVSDQGTELSQQVDDFMWFELRLKIEANLIESPGSPIGLFQLPEVMGGYLDLARDIVVATIEAMSSAGEPTRTADKHLGRGDNYYDQGEYKRAYKEYQNAYQAAVLIGGRGNDD